MVKSASQNWELQHSTRTVLEETDCGHQRQEADRMKHPKQACHDHRQPFERVRAQAQIPPGPQGSRTKDQEAPGRRKLNRSCAEKVKGTEDEVVVETERPRWTERSASNAEPAVQANPVQRSSRRDRKQRTGLIATISLEPHLRHQLHYHQYS